MGSLQNRSRRCGKETIPLPQSGIEPQFLGLAASSLFTIPAELEVPYIFMDICEVIWVVNKSLFLVVQAD
jgi:hypothetical protein